MRLSTAPSRSAAWMPSDVCPGGQCRFGGRETREEHLSLLGKRRVVAGTPHTRLLEVRSSLNKGFSGQIIWGKAVVDSSLLPEITEAPSPVKGLKRI